MKTNKVKLDPEKILEMKRATVAYLETLYDKVPEELKAQLMLPGVLNASCGAKKTFLLEPGMDASKAYYLHKGLAILYTMSRKKGKKKIFYIWREGEIIVLLKAFRDRLKNKDFYIQLIENSELVSITNLCMDDIYQQHIAAHELTRRINDLKTERRVRQLDILMEEKQDRYVLFVSLFPDLYNRLTGEQTCGFIGINPTMLKISKRKFLDI